jgi:excinuclease ABC subunit C
MSDKTAQKLLTELKSVKGIKEATLAELSAIIGNSKASLVYEFFKAQIS